MNTMVETQHAFIEGLKATNVPISEEMKGVALNAISSTALPTTRVEAWKYTRLAKIGKTNFISTQGQLDSIEDFIADSEATTLVFVNGFYSEELSSKDFPEGVQVELLSRQDSPLSESRLTLENELFHAINTAYLNDGVSIQIAANANVETPIQVIHVLTGNATISNFRTRIAIAKSARASVIQGFYAKDAENCLANVITEVEVAENAHFTIDKVQFEDEGNFHIGTDQVWQDKNSTFTINTVTLNGSLVRNNLNIDVAGQNCETNLNGAYLLKGKQHVDNHTTVDHQVANCESNELYKGVIDDNSTAVFNGKVFVRQDAQKINAFQSNGNVLLSDDATVNSKPELEIYADDVRCSHGSTTGQLDEEAVFYLRARGMSEKSARQLMVSAFVGEALEKIENPRVSSYINSLLTKRFGWMLD